MRERVAMVALALMIAWSAPGRAQTATSPGTATSLSLADAVARASHGTAAVQISSFKTREAVARVNQARAALLPTLNGTAYTQERTFSSASFGISFPHIPGQPGIPDLVGPVHQVDARVRATQTLFDAASWVHLRAVRQGVVTSRAEDDGAGETAARDAALAFVRAARAGSSIAARQSDLDLATELSSLATSQVEAGTAAEIDVIRARTQATTARGQLLVAKNEAERAQLDLARALGLDPDERFTLTDTLSTSLASSEAPLTVAAAVAMAFERRPEERAEHAKLERARIERRAIGAERLPRVDASADYGVDGARAADAIATRQVTLQLTVPVFDGFRREARIAEQREIESESEVRERDLRRQIEAEVQSALLEVGSGVEQEGIARERLSLAESELAHARERFANGVAGNIEVINAQSSLIQARDAVIDARAATATARIHLAHATGVAETMR